MESGAHANQKEKMRWKSEQPDLTHRTKHDLLKAVERLFQACLQRKHFIISVELIQGQI